MIPPATHEAPSSHSFIRGPRKTDQAFVAATWARQMQRAEPRNATGARFGLLGRQIDAVLERDDTRALLRHTAGDRDAILGWVVYAEGVGVPLVHFCYVRNEHRGKGYASELLTAIGITPTTPYVYTCRGQSTLRMLSKFKAGSFLSLGEFLA